MTSNNEFVRTADIAQLTGASIRTVRRWIADEIIPSAKLGRTRLVAKADLNSVLLGQNKHELSAITEFQVGHATLRVRSALRLCSLAWRTGGTCRIQDLCPTTGYTLLPLPS
jgi:excisionase family DNA binding protein